MESKIFRKILKLLELSGVWVDRGSSYTRIVLAVLSHLIFIDAFAVFAIMHLSEVKTLQEFYDIVVQDILFFIALIASTTLVTWNKPRIENLLKESEMMEKLWITQTGGKKLQKRIMAVIKVLIRVVTVFLILGVLSLISFIVTLETPDISVPYDYKRNKIIYWLTMIHQFIGSFVLVPLFFMCHYFSEFFVCFATGVVEELNEKLLKVMENPVVEMEPSTSKGLVSKLKTQSTKTRAQKLMEEAQKRKVRQEKHLKELLECIEFHLKIRTFVKEVESVCGALLGVQGALSVFFLCTSSVSLIFVSIQPTFLWFSRT
jgi:hypothetical protein